MAPKNIRVPKRTEQGKKSTDEKHELWHSVFHHRSRALDRQINRMRRHQSTKENKMSVLKSRKARAKAAEDESKKIVINTETWKETIATKPIPPLPPHELSDLEKSREDNIRRNEAFMAGLGFVVNKPVAPIGTQRIVDCQQEYKQKMEAWKRKLCYLFDVQLWHQVDLFVPASSVQFHEKNDLFILRYFDVWPYWFPGYITARSSKTNTQGKGNKHKRVAVDGWTVLYTDGQAQWLSEIALIDSVVKEHQLEVWFPGAVEKLMSLPINRDTVLLSDVFI